MISLASRVCARRSAHRTLVPVVAGVATWATLLAAGCEASPRAAPERAPIDSLGFRVVSTETPAWERGGGWEIDPRARADIAGPAAEEALPDEGPGGQGSVPNPGAAGEPRSFGYVWAAVYLGHDRIAIADLSTYRVHLFDGRGRPLAAFGHRGVEPGEFGSLSRMFRYRGDSLAIHDMASHRLTLFDSEGRLGRVVSTGEARNARTPIGGFADGRFLVRELGGARGRGRGGDGNAEREAILLMASPTLDRLVEIARIPQLGPAGRAGDSPSYFFPTTELVVGAGSIYWGRSDRYEVRSIALDGAPDHVIRRPWTPETVTPEMWAAFRDSIVWRVPDPDVAARMSAARHATTLPAFGVVKTAPGDQVWVQRYGIPGSADSEVWDVFDGAGKWLGPMRLPAGARLLDVGDDAVLVSRRSDTGGESVQVHGIRPATNSPTG